MALTQADLDRLKTISFEEVVAQVVAARSLADVRKVRKAAHDIWFRECVRRHALNSLQRHDLRNLLPLFWLHLVSLVERYKHYEWELSIAGVEALVHAEAGELDDIQFGVLPPHWRSRFVAWRPVQRIKPGYGENRLIDRQAWNEFMEDWRVEEEAMLKGDEVLRDLRPRR